MASHHFQSGERAGSPVEGAHARNGISFAPSWESAVNEVIADAMAGSVTAPDLVVMFVSSAWSHAYQRIIDRVRNETGCNCLIGCSSSGVIADATCHESAPGISLMAMWLPGAVLTPLRIESVPATWPWDETVSQDNVSGIILFSEPYRTDAQSTLVGLRRTCPGVPMVGALASTTASDRRAWVYLGDSVYAQGAVAVAIEGPYDLLVNVSQGGTPIGSPWTITSTDHNQIITISNRRAIDVMHDTLDEIAANGFGVDDLLVGFPMDEYQDHFVREDFVARGILGTENATGSIMVGGIPRQGQSIQFLLRDPSAASADLTARLQALQHLQPPVVGGILSSCKGRGAAMFGRNDHDAAAVARALPDVPVIGLYSAGELGPVRHVPAYNAFAASLGLIVER